MEELKKQFDIARWMAEDLAGTLPEEERSALREWLDASARHAALYAEIRRDFEAGRYGTPYSREEVEAQLERFYRRNRRDGRRMRRTLRWMGYAAAVVLVVGTIFYVNEWQEKVGEPRPLAKAEVVMIPKANARLILSTGEQVDLDGERDLTSEEENVQIERQADGLSYVKLDSVRPAEVRYNTLVVPRGGDFKVSLADGTVVWLNSCTQLRYPVEFTGGRREVFLDGEAYFEVAKDAGKPFIVRTKGDVAVRVLGTKFNVAAYEADESVTTTLAEGSVEVVMPREKRVISPDEQLIFDLRSGQFECREVDAAMYSAWKDGMFVFENETLERLMERLKMWYDVEVFYTSDIVRNYRFTGDLKRYEDFSRIVRLIEEVAGVSVRINGNCIIIGTK